MSVETFLGKKATRRAFTTGAGFVIARILAGNPTAHADSSTPSEPAANKNVFTIVENPLISEGVPTGRRFGKHSAEAPLNIPPDIARLRLSMSISTEGPEAGLFIDNGPDNNDPNFSRLTIARINGIWGIGQLIGKEVKKMGIDIPSDQNSLDLDFRPSVDGSAGTLALPDMPPQEYSFHHSMFGVTTPNNQLFFSAYSLGDSKSTINKLEAVMTE